MLLRSCFCGLALSIGLLCREVLGPDLKVHGLWQVEHPKKSPGIDTRPVTSEEDVTGLGGARQLSSSVQLKP